MNFIQTDRINNNNLIRSFPISGRSVKTLFSIGLVGVNSSIRRISREYCWMDGEYSLDLEYYIDEDIAYSTYKYLLARQVEDEREFLLPCYLRLIDELDSICQYTRKNPQRCGSN